MISEELKQRIENTGPYWNKFTVDGYTFGGNYGYEVDERLNLFIANFGNVKTILELGSCEGWHTVKLAKLPSVEHVAAVEGRELNIKRARLIHKLFNVDNVELLQGNLETFDLTTLGHFDVAYVVGLLYHLSNPWRLVEQLSKVTDNVFFWTHYSTKRETCVNGYGGLYVKDNWPDNTLAGLADESFFLLKEELFRLCRDCGFTNIRVLAEHSMYDCPGTIFIASKPK